MSRNLDHVIMFGIIIVIGHSQIANYCIASPDLQRFAILAIGTGNNNIPTSTYDSNLL